MGKQNSGGGMGFFSWLLLLFIALKLGGVIEWSWWWVLAPAWIRLGGIFVFAIAEASIEIQKKRAGG